MPRSTIKNKKLLIKSVKVAKDAPCGPLLTIEASKSERIPKIIWTKLINGKKYKLLSIDWVHTDSALLREMKQKVALNTVSIESLEYILINYCKKHDLSTEWKTNCFELLNIPNISNGS